VRAFDEDAVVFDGRSGHTHHLSDSAARILAVLQENGPATAQAVLQASAECVADEQFGRRMLDDLQHAGLIEAITPAGA